LDGNIWCLRKQCENKEVKLNKDSSGQTVAGLTHALSAVPDDQEQETTGNYDQHKYRQQ
jgi:hypothetical protein